MLSGSVRYYFHLQDDIVTRDTEGQEFATHENALRHAQGEARAMASVSVLYGSLDLQHFLEVTNDGDEPAFRVTFGEVVTIKDLVDQARPGSLIHVSGAPSPVNVRRPR